MKLSPRIPSRWLACIISADALVGSYVAWRLWFVAGGWNRAGHSGEAILWGTCAVIGLWSAFRAIRIDRGTSFVTSVAGSLIIVHILALLLLTLFLHILLSGQMPR